MDLQAVGDEVSRSTPWRMPPIACRPVVFVTPALIGVGVAGTPSGRDAVALASLIAGATGGELMLTAVYEEPLLEGVVPQRWAGVLIG